MATSIQIALQNLQQLVSAKHKIFITQDPNFDVGRISADVYFKAKIKNIKLGINQHIGSMDL